MVESCYIATLHIVCSFASRSKSAVPGTADCFYCDRIIRHDGSLLLLTGAKTGPGHGDCDGVSAKSWKDAVKLVRKNLQKGSDVMEYKVT